MSKELIKVAPRAVPATIQPSMLDMPPEQLLNRSIEVANLLKQVCKARGLVMTIQGRDYALVEAWQLCGMMLGFTAQEGPVTELEDGSVVAECQLFHVASQRVVARATALCGIDEKKWGKADRYARRSMAVTRAEGKVYRMNFSWVLKMAGLEPTPAEEMPQFSDVPPPASRPGYDPDDPQKVAWLEKALDAHNIPKGKHVAIAERMIGRPSADLLRVVDELAVETGEI